MKYLHSVLTVIAFCLVIITCSLLGLIPAAKAGSPNHFISVPVNSDGSINVRFPKTETLDVNIDEVGGRSQLGNTLDVNIDEVGNHSLYGAVPVQIEK